MAYLSTRARPSTASGCAASPRPKYDDGDIISLTRMHQLIMARMLWCAEIEKEQLSNARYRRWSQVPEGIEPGMRPNIIEIDESATICGVVIGSGCPNEVFGVVFAVVATSHQWLRLISADIVGSRRYS